MLPGIPGTVRSVINLVYTRALMLANLTPLVFINVVNLLNLSLFIYGVMYDDVSKI